MRLTRKDDFNVEHYTTKELATELDCIDKLGQLEDIEDELGIDSIVLLKAVKNGVWCKHPYSIDYEVFRIDHSIDYETNEEYTYICGMLIEDYGKTWALTREELL